MSSQTSQTSKTANPVILGIEVTDEMRARIDLPLSVKGATLARHYANYMVAKRILSDAWNGPGGVASMKGKEGTPEGNARRTAYNAYMDAKVQVAALQALAAPNWTQK